MALLDASSHLYNRAHWSISLSVRCSVGHTFIENRRNRCFTTQHTQGTKSQEPKHKLEYLKRRETIKKIKNQAYAYGQILTGPSARPHPNCLSQTQNSLFLTRLLIPVDVSGLFVGILVSTSVCTFVCMSVI